MGPRRSSKFNIKRISGNVLKILLDNYNATMCRIIIQASTDGVDSKLLKP